MEQVSLPKLWPQIAVRSSPYHAKRVPHLQDLSELQQGPYFDRDFQLPRAILLSPTGPRSTGALAEVEVQADWGPHRGRRGMKGRMGSKLSYTPDTCRRSWRVMPRRAATWLRESLPAQNSLTKHGDGDGGAPPPQPQHGQELLRRSPCQAKHSPRSRCILAAWLQVVSSPHALRVI